MSPPRFTQPSAPGAARAGVLTVEQVHAEPLTAGKAIRKLQDGGGLFLMVDANGKAWRYRYRFAGKDSLLSLGVYPAVGLAQARTLAGECRARLDRGENPSEARRRARDDAWLEAAKTFGVVAAEYNASRAGAAAATVARCKRMYQHSKKLHGRTFAQIERPDILGLCETRGRATRETAHRLAMYVGQVFMFARDKGYYNGADPTAGGLGKSLSRALGTAQKTAHRPALTESRAVGGLMRNVDAGEFLMLGATVTRALQLLARTATRPGELANAEWAEIDLDGSCHDGHPTWVIPLHRMKMRDAARTDHVVPLSRQAVEILAAQHALTGHGKYVFPNERSERRPMTDSAMSAAMIALSYRGQHVPHGFRTTFKTLAQDKLKVESEIVERQLAHRIGSDVAGAYDRSQRLEERRDLMQRYSDLLDKLRDG